MAVAHLRKNGYQIVATNFIAPLGRSPNGRALTGEIDIIAYDLSTTPPTLAFIEVKTRSRTEIALPQAAVDRRKQRQIIRAARVYRRVMRVVGEAYRYDVVAVLVRRQAKQAAEIHLLPGYFSEERYQRAR